MMVPLEYFWNISLLINLFPTWQKLKKNVIISIGDGVGKWTFYNILREVVQTCYSYFF